MFVFLGAGGRGLLDGRRWPLPLGDTPGAWLAGDERFPVRGYPLAELPLWFDDELWEVDLEGAIRQVEHAVAADRGRLVRRIAGWDAQAARAFVAAAAERARLLAVHALETDGYATQAAAIAAAPSDRLVAVCGTAAASLAGIHAELAAFPADCVRYADDAHSPGAAAAVAGYVAAHASGRWADDYDEGAEAERAWQARWLAAVLDLRDRECSA